MGHFFVTPPPIISATGAQPYAPNKLPPSITAVPVNNPPQNEDALDSLIEVLAIWNPDVVHNYIHKAGQPYDYAKLSPGIPGQSIDNPIPNEDTAVNFTVVRAVWDAATFNNNPILPKNNAPGIPGQSIDNPIPNEDTAVNFNNVISIWNPIPVHNYIHRAGQPYDYAKMAPGIPGQSVDNPPQIKGFVPYPITPDPTPTLPIIFMGKPGWSVDNPPSFTRQQLPYPDTPLLPQTLVLQPQPFVSVVTVQGPYTNLWMATVVSLWPSSYDLPQLGTKLPPQITAVPVNNPPFYSRTELPNILQQWVPPDPQPALSIRSVGNPGWSVDNPIFSRGFVPYPLPPDPLPTLPIKSVGNPGWSVDNPIGVRQPFVYPDLSYGLPQTLVLQPQGTTTVVASQGPYTNQWLATVIGAWQPSDLQPILAFKLPPQITAVAVNNPPFNSRTELPNILAQWQPPPPQPTPSVRINIIQGGSAPIVTVREWLIRARRRRR